MNAFQAMVPAMLLTTLFGSIMVMGSNVGPVF